MSLDNAIVIKNYNPLEWPAEYFYTHGDWDLVELNVNIDGNKLFNWYTALTSEFKENIFRFDDYAEKLDIEKSKELVSQGHCGLYCGPIYGITLAWPKERYEPLPPPKQCNPEMFPEVNPDTFVDDALLLEKYKTGYFKYLVELLGVDSFRQAIVVCHKPTMKILQHRDNPNILKLHIPVHTNKDAVFKFGKDGEREYRLKVGKIYLLNTGGWHGTDNQSPTEDRIHIITRITPTQLSKILELK